MTQRTGIIYLAWNCIEGKGYVGKTLMDFSLRICAHQSNARRGSTTNFHNAYRRDGEDVFDWRVLEADVPMSEMDARERFWIGAFDSYHRGYNMNSGGAGPGVHSEVTKAKMRKTQRSLALAGKNPSQRPEARAKFSTKLRQQVADGTHPMHDDSIRAKNAASNSKTWRKLVAQGKGPTQLETPEAKAQRAAKISASHLQRSPQERAEAVQKLRLTQSRNRIAAQVEAGQLFFL